MGLQKSYSAPAGTGNYWRIGKITADYMTQVVEVRMDLYTDRAARDSDIGIALDSRSIYYNGSDFSAICSGSLDARAAAYAKVKIFQQLDSLGNVAFDYSGSTDV